MQCGQSGTQGLPPTPGTASNTPGQGQGSRGDSCRWDFYTQTNPVHLESGDVCRAGDDGGGGVVPPGAASGAQTPPFLLEKLGGRASGNSPGPKRSGIAPGWGPGWDPAVGWGG